MLSSRVALGSLKEFQEGLWEKKKSLSNGSEIQEKLSLAVFNHHSAEGQELPFTVLPADLISSFSVAFTVNYILWPDGFMMWTDKP